MEHFSSNEIAAFSGLRLKQILVLLQVLDDAEYKTKDYIKRRYLEQAENFEATVDFLVELHTLKFEGEALFVSGPLASMSRTKDLDNLGRLVIDLMVRRKNRYSSEAFAYLSLFNVNSEGKVTYRPSDTERSEQSAVRNFMMDLEIVSFDESINGYTINPGKSAIFADAICGPFNKVSPQQLKELKREQEEIGFAAELEIVMFERKRIGRKYASEVEHVAQTNAAAGYDVRSITIRENGDVYPRYIEVKAVPRGSFQFYWTENEQKVAKTFASWYYLYLLPAGEAGEFLTEDLMILENPYSSVLNSPDEWVVEHNVTRCYMKAGNEPNKHADL